jgi:hypothetical protein
MCATSPRPEEPDLHIQFSSALGVVIDVCACRSAALHFVAAWRKCHPPDQVVRLVPDGCTAFPRLGTERLWLWE